MPTNRRPKKPLALRAIRQLMRWLSRISPKLAARLAFRLWHYPQRHPLPRREQTWLDSARLEQVQYRGDQLTLYQWGAGEPVLLVHGWDGRGTQMGSFAEPLVAAGYRVVALDLPAHGKSGQRRTNMLESASAIYHVAGSIGPLAAVIAHSFGAGATAKALADGMEARKAILISPPANLRWLVDNYHRMLGLSARATRQLEQILVQTYGESIWQEVSTDHNMATAGLPGLIVHDREDRDVPYAQSEQLHKHWSESRLLTTSGLGHRRILRDKQVIDQCVKFVSDSSIDWSRT